jgi:16S rRNA processing protein RimM
LNHSTDREQQWLQIARILKPRGNKGEVAAELLSDFSARFSSLAYVYLGKDSGRPERVALKRFWADQNHPGQGVFHFEGSNTISDAERFRGLGVFLPIEQRVTLPAGQYFVTDLIGCTVFETPAHESILASPACAAGEAPRVLGTVRDVFFPGESVAGTPLLDVLTSSGELLIPLAEEICTRIEVGSRRIDVILPEGLRSVNASD